MTDLENKSMDQIEKRGLVPRPYAYFMAKQSVFWTLALLSIILGAVSVAVTIYGVRYTMATGGATLDEIPFDDLFESLPFVWLVVLPLFVASAHFAVAHTRSGYRLRTSGIVAGALLASAVLGAMLHQFDVGIVIHQFLNAHVPAYDRMVRTREDYWMAPDEGKLGGRVLAVGPNDVLTVRDFSGREWKVDFAGAPVRLSEPIMDEGIIGIFGVRTGPATFRAHSIEEWDEVPSAELDLLLPTQVGIRNK